MTYRPLHLQVGLMCGMACLARFDQLKALCAVFMGAGPLLPLEEMESS